MFQAGRVCSLQFAVDPSVSNIYLSESLYHQLQSTGTVFTMLQLRVISRYNNLHNFVYAECWVVTLIQPTNQFIQVLFLRSFGHS